MVSQEQLLNLFSMSKSMKKTQLQNLLKDFTDDLVFVYLLIDNKPETQMCNVACPKII